MVSSFPSNKHFLDNFNHKNWSCGLQNECCLADVSIQAHQTLDCISNPTPHSPPFKLTMPNKQIYFRNKLNQYILNSSRGVKMLTDCNKTRCNHVYPHLYPKHSSTCGNPDVLTLSPLSAPVSKLLFTHYTASSL